MRLESTLISNDRILSQQKNKLQYICRIYRDYANIRQAFRQPRLFSTQFTQYINLAMDPLSPSNGRKRKTYIVNAFRPIFTTIATMPPVVDIYVINFTEVWLVKWGEKFPTFGKLTPAIMTAGMKYRGSNRCAGMRLRQQQRMNPVIQRGPRRLLSFDRNTTAHRAYSGASITVLHFHSE